jgi:4-aminobutyrate aminotransferase/(S)-3-amino-2-methylpropionate transaminase
MGVRPDLVTLGKSIAAGLPLSALAGEPALFEKLAPHSLGGTYPGNPVACAAGLAVLDVIEGERLMERAGAIGKVLELRWRAMAAGNPAIREVRGLGSMVGVEFESAEIVEKVIAGALKRGVLMISAGEGRVIRHLMPLVITDDQLEEAFEAIGAAVADQGP